MGKRAALLHSIGKRKDGGSESGGRASSRSGLREKGENFYKTGRDVRRNRMYNAKPDLEKMSKVPTEPARIAPSRKWFDNTRVVGQDKLEQFREALANKKADPRMILLKSTKLPISLFDHSKESKNKRASNLLTVEPFGETFSAKRRQKRPRLLAAQLEELVQNAEQSSTNFIEKTSAATRDGDVSDAEDTTSSGPIAPVMLKGTSRRIWGELYKVVDSSDVLVEVLDVRDPMGTRSRQLEQHIKKDRPFKHIVLLLNKCDLVPTWVTDRWIEVLGKEFPTIAFKASVDHPFGKRALIGVLRQFADLMKNRKHVSVGFIGYPNVGKSSVINTLRGKKVCVTAPIPGETKVWQYVDLTSKIYLIDCPGIVRGSEGGHSCSMDSSVKKILRGVVRAEKIHEAENYMGPVIETVGRDNIHAHYGVEESDRSWTDVNDLLELLARRWGRLGKGGEPIVSQVATKIIMDIQRGKVPYFIQPPPGKAKPPKNTVASKAGDDEPAVEKPRDEEATVISSV